MDVPSHLLNPPAGGWSIREAASLWAWICYATPPTAPDTSEVRRIRVQAHREIRAIASRVPGSAGVTVTPPKPMRERTNHLGGPDYDWWQLEPSPSPPQKTAPKIVYPAWVTRAALEALCARRGVPFGSSPPRAAGAPVVALEGAEERSVVTGGRPSTNAAAYAFIDELLAGGMGKSAAYREAARKYPSRGVDLDTRAHRLEAGYYQRDRGRRKISK